MLEKIRALIEPIIIEHGYRIDELTFELEGNVKNLRVVIDKNGIIDLEDCITVSKLINPILDEADPIDEFYVLDVCSKERGCE